MKTRIRVRWDTVFTATLTFAIGFAAGGTITAQIFIH